MFRERLAVGLFFILVMGVMPVAIGAATAGLRHGELVGGQQAAHALFESLARTNAFLDAAGQVPPSP